MDRPTTASHSLSLSTVTRVKAMEADEIALRNRQAAQLRRERAAYRLHKQKMAVSRRAQPTRPPSAQTDLILFFGFVLAIFKDMLDLAFVGSIPVLGTLVTAMVSSGIILILMVHGLGAGHRRVRRTLRRVGVIAAASLIEGFFFGLNFVPLETIAMAVTYHMVRRDRRRDWQKYREEMKKYSRQRVWREVYV